MGAVESVLSYLVTPDVPSWTIPALVIDLAGLAVAVWLAYPPHIAPARARAWMWFGMAVVAGGPLVSTSGAMITGIASSSTSGWTLATLSMGAVGLLCVGAGMGRLTSAQAHARRVDRAIEAVALVLVAAGLTAVALAIANQAGSPWAPQTPIPGTLLAPIGWSVVLLGSALVVAANASGRVSGPVPYRRRRVLSLVAFGFAATIVTAMLVSDHVSGAVGGLILSGSDSAMSVLLAWSARRVLRRPAAVDYWMASQQDHRLAHSKRARGSGRAATHVTRIVPSLPRVAMPVVTPGFGIPIVLSAPLASARPFTPPVLRRAVFARNDEVAGAVPPPGFTPEILAAAPETSDTTRTNLIGASRIDANLAPRSPLSPQFVAALLNLQTEMLRAGKEYSIEELMGVFADVPPPPIAHQQAASDHVSTNAPFVALPLTVPLAEPTDADQTHEPPPTPRYRLNIVP